jgi:hypothetical protein
MIDFVVVIERIRVWYCNGAGQDRVFLCYRKCEAVLDIVCGNIRVRGGVRRRVKH